MKANHPEPRSLEPGTRLGPYEISGRIGVGGMGEVYRATDTNLRRSVAVKVLPPGFAEDPERLARFEREAQLLAQLQHPNIASIFGLEESDGVRALVLELVEGPTLAERLEAGPLPLETSLAIAVQVAQALEQAHDRGIVHRDLKPQNVKAPVDGEVKVLDFGLAKAIDAGAQPGVLAELSMSPTMLESPTLTAAHGTRVGVILGTAAYMSPEQARGAMVDKRADIWAFGVLLYEMLVGRSLFAGESVPDTLAGVLKAEIDWSMLPPDTPAALHRLLRRCLERNPRNRLHDIADARIVLQEIAADPERHGERPGQHSVPGGAAAASGRGRWLPWAIAWVAVAAAVGLSVRDWSGGIEPATRPLEAFGILVPEGGYVARTPWGPPLDLSADGQTFVLVRTSEDESSLFRRDFDRLGFTRIPGTEGAEQPVLSPDGRTIAFFSGDQLRKVPTEGGAPATLAAAPGPRGASWAADGSIVFSPAYLGGLWRVPGTGGDPVPVTTLDASRNERTHRWPQVLPDGNTVIFTVGVMGSSSDYDAGTIDAVRLDTGERRTILKGARIARFTAGYLVFQRGHTLLAVGFDPESLERQGQPFVIQEDVGGDDGSGGGYFAVDEAGSVVIVPERAILAERMLAISDPEGRVHELPLEPEQYSSPRFSPRGDRLAFAVGGGGLADDVVYLYELATDRARRLTFREGRGYPTWSPDGRQIVFTSIAAGQQGLITKMADGSGGEVPVPIQANLPPLLIVDAWLPDGRLVVTDVERSLDVLLVDPAHGTVSPLLANPELGESRSSVSPNGRYIAYTSTETGSNEVFVESFPLGEGKWQVSAQGGECPAWSRDGRRLYFAHRSTLMVVDVESHDLFRSGLPRELLAGPYRLCLAGRREYDVGPDGRLVLVKHRPNAGTPRQLVLLQGWQVADPDGAPAR